MLAAMTAAPLRGFLVTPDALPATILPIYPGLGQAQEYAGLHPPVAWLDIPLAGSTFPDIFVCCRWAVTQCSKT